MKKFILVLFLVYFAWNPACSQSELEKKIKTEIWTNAPADFKNVQVPEKWKNESAVVLAYFRDYTGDFTTKVTGVASVSKYYIEMVKIHFRIKLLDKAAVEEFSELSFDNKTVKTNIFGRASAYRIIGIKVIKPNGTETEVDLSKAVKNDAGSKNDLKIPVPNLETGDVLDYFIALRDESSAMPNFGDEILLEGKYPIVSNSFRFSVPHEVAFRSYTYNDKFEFDRKEVKNDVIYTFRDTMRNKEPDLLWDYPLRTAPHFRYRINGTSFNTRTESRVSDILTSFNFNNSDIGFILDYMNGNFKKEKDPVILVNELYELLRNPIYLNAYFKIKQGNPMDPDYIPMEFFQLADKYLKKSKIDHDVLIVPPRTHGPMSTLVDLEPCDMVIKVNTTPPLFISRPNPFSIASETPTYYENMDGMSTGSSSKLDENLSHTKNYTKTLLNISLDSESPDQLKVIRTVRSSGHNKRFHQFLIFTNYDYLKEYDKPKYQVQSSSLMKGIIKEYNKEKVKFEQRLTQDYAERDKRIKESIESDLEAKVISYKNLDVKSIGMWAESPQTFYSDEMVLENLVQKAGPNHILELGKLMEKQTEIKPAQLKRERDIYMDYPRSYQYEIMLNIPEGYTVEGYEKFAHKVENETGGFVSSAKLEGQKLIITTNKYYTKNYYEAKKWPDILSFLQAALDCYNTKVLFKKKA